jgi:hypothetical protein
MSYYRFPIKQKSRITIEKKAAFKNYGRIISQAQLSKLSNKELEEQKQLFLEDIKELDKDYSLSSFDEKLKKISNKISKIGKLCKNLEVLIKKNRDLIRITNSYYIEEAIFFSDYITIQRASCMGNLKELIKAEKEIFQELESKEYQDLNYYFYEISSLIPKYYLVFELNLFKGKFYPWSSVVDSQIKKNFAYDNFTVEDKNLPMSFEGVVDEVMNKNPEGGNGGYLFKPKSTYEEFVKRGKVPDWGSHGNESSWNNSFSKFSRCSSQDHKKAALILRFDEINYSKLIDEAKLSKYCYKIRNGIYADEGTLVDRDFYKKFLPLAKEALNRVLRKITLIERTRFKSQEKQTNLGYVYVLESIGYPGVYKIGSTYGLPEERAEELSGTNVPDPWTVISQIKIKDAEYYEKQIHKLLKNFRYRKGREFFKLDLRIIKKCLKDVFQCSNKGEKKIKFNELEKEIKIKLNVGTN